MSGCTPFLQYFNESSYIRAARKLAKELNELLIGFQKTSAQQPIAIDEKNPSFSTVTSRSDPLPGTFAHYVATLLSVHVVKEENLNGEDFEFIHEIAKAPPEQLLSKLLNPKWRKGRVFTPEPTLHDVEAEALCAKFQNFYYQNLDYICAQAVWKYETVDDHRNNSRRTSTALDTSQSIRSAACSIAITPAGTVTRATAGTVTSMSKKQPVASPALSFAQHFVQSYAVPSSNPSPSLTSAHPIREVKNLNRPEISAAQYALAMGKYRAGWDQFWCYAWLAMVSSDETYKCFIELRISNVINTLRLRNNKKDYNPGETEIAQERYQIVQRYLLSGKLEKSFVAAFKAAGAVMEAVPLPRRALKPTPKPAAPIAVPKIITVQQQMPPLNLPPPLANASEALRGSFVDTNQQCGSSVIISTPAP